jgi:hypothetical protein
MNAQDEKWLNLLRASSLTFAPEPTPPYGFMTGMISRLLAEERQQQEAERIGWRALLASMAALVIAAAVTLSLNRGDSSSEFDPGVKSLVQMDNISLS